jgi:hypothetical protein
MSRLQPILQLTFHARIDLTCFFVAIFVAALVTAAILGGEIDSEAMICLLLVFLEARQPKLLMHRCALECHLMLASLPIISPKH